MRPTYSNQPINKPVRRREPAVKTLAVMSVVIAMMFGVRLFNDPGQTRSDGEVEEAAAQAAAAAAEPEDEAGRLADGVIMVGGEPSGTETTESETTADETSADTTS